MRGGRQLTVVVTSLIGAAAVALGYFGYREAEPSLSAFDAAYAAAQLLALEYNGPIGPPLALELARYLGALALGLAVLLVVGALARDWINNRWIRVRVRGHIVIIGLGERGAAVAKGLRGGAKVVAVDIDPEARDRAEQGTGRLAFIEGDARTKATYESAAADKADHVVIVPGDDSLNLQALELCLQHLADRRRRLGPGRPAREPTIHVAIEDEDLWRRVHPSSLTWSGAGRPIEFISVPDRVGLAMVEEVMAELQDARDGRPGRVLLWGAGLKAVRTAVHAVRSILVAGGRPELVLAGPGSEGLLGEIRATEPWLESSAEVELWGEPASAGYDAALVVGLSHADALAAAAALATTLSGTRLLVEVPRVAGEEALQRSGFPIEDVELIDAEVRVLGDGVVETSARELLARAKHQDYLAQERTQRKRQLAAGLVPEPNPSAVPWPEAPRWLRESNRAFADAVGARLADLGAELVPLEGPPPPISELISEERVLELAVLEHERWMADKLAHGWTYAPGAKDDEARTHPSLVPFAQLPDDEKRKDVDAVRVIPKLLARMGYAIRVPPDPKASKAVVG